MISKSQLRELERCTRNLLSVNHGMASSVINLLKQIEANPLDRSIIVLNGHQAGIRVTANPLVHVAIEEPNLSVLVNHSDYELKIKVKKNSCGFLYQHGGYRRDNIIEQLYRIISMQGWDVITETLNVGHVGLTAKLIELKNITPTPAVTKELLELELSSIVDKLEGVCIADYALYGCSNYHGGVNDQILTYSSLQERLGPLRYREGDIFSGLTIMELIKTTVTDLIWTYERVGTDYEALYILIPTIRGTIVGIIENGAILFAIPEKIKHLLSLNNGFIPGMLLAELILGTKPFNDISSRMRTLSIGK